METQCKFWKLNEDGLEYKFGSFEVLVRCSYHWATGLMASHTTTHADSRP